MRTGPKRPDTGPLVTISVQLEDVQVDQLDRRAKRLGVSRQALLRAIVRKYGDRDVQFAP